MSTPTPKPKLRLITYLSPGVPIEFFETVLQYLESVLGVNAWMIREFRWSGPPVDRDDPFTEDEVDIGFMCSTAYLRLQYDNNLYVERCPVAACHQHPKAHGRPVYFSDVVVHEDNKAKFKTFNDLKGCRWAFNDDISLSGNLVVLAELKQMGTNPSFFGNVVQSGGHNKSIQMILDQKVDAAAIDCNVLSDFAANYPERMAKLHTITSLGPMPIYPIVFNSRMSADLKKKVTEALLALGNAPDWGDRLRAVNVTGFVPSDMSFYNIEAEVKDLVKNFKINAA